MECYRVRVEAQTVDLSGGITLCYSVSGEHSRELLNRHARKGKAGDNEVRPQAAQQYRRSEGGTYTSHMYSRRLERGSKLYEWFI